MPIDSRSDELLLELISDKAYGNIEELISDEEYNVIQQAEWIGGYGPLQCAIIASSTAICESLSEIKDVLAQIRDALPNGP